MPRGHRTDDADGGRDREWNGQHHGADAQFIGILSPVNRADIAVRLSRASAPALAIGAAVGGAVVFRFAAQFKWMFDVPGGGVGLVTVSKYPKGWDYAVVVSLIVLAALGAFALAVLTARPRRVAARP